jgi:hypothetical protein
MTDFIGGSLGGLRLSLVETTVKTPKLSLKPRFLSPLSKLHPDVWNRAFRSIGKGALIWRRGLEWLGLSSVTSATKFGLFDGR